MTGTTVITYGEPVLRANEWMQNGVLHRSEDWWADRHGVFSAEESMTDRVYHRTDGPAEMLIRDGVVVKEYFYFQGSLHRLDGPAVTFRDNDGSVCEESWWCLGAHAANPEQVGLHLRSQRKEKVEAAVLGSPFARLLGGEVGSYEIADALTTGVHTVAGIEAILGGAPLEWALAFERGQAR